MKSNRKPMFRRALLASTIAMLASGNAFAEKVTFHSDTRTSAKLILAPQVGVSKDMDLDLAQAYVQNNAERLGINKGQSLQFSHQQQSLLGTHYYFQQYLGKVAVDKAEVIVTVAKDGHTITKVFNNAYPTSHAIERRGKLNIGPKLSAEQAIDRAWNILQVRDQLTSAPRSELVYFVDQKGQFHLTHKVHIAAEGETGGRMMYIDADKGALLHHHSTTLRRHGHMPTLAELAKRKGPVLDRHAQVARFDQEKAPANVTRAIASATALVFDPDPRTTLQDKSLEDNSPASSFTAAYLTRTMQGLNLSGGVYSLDGQYVNIKEIENPKTAPSTTTDGNWTAVRGDNAFNDATTYFHLDQNQRYMQSLGFTGATGIIERPFDVDTDGLSGADNSHYSYGGSTDYVAFGHGDVDDNEDADVILHEYGHAIHYNINSNWSGGDTGAMGEGFGDYWAGSYSYSTPNGQTHFPDEVMSWDGQSASSWAGRVMNLTSAAQYDHNHNYGAHATHNGVNGDELWSTPLFQALKDLMAQGRPRAEMDQIVLEAHFGLGSGMKMRDMANAIVATAEALFPTGPHADVYRAKFDVHNILDGDVEPPTATPLVKGEAVALSGASGSNVYYTLDTPADVGAVSFNMSGGSGDADLYVKFGSTPTSSSYDCRPYASGNNETCDFATGQTGTYHVMINGYSSYSGASLVGDYDGGTTPPTGGDSGSVTDISVGSKEWTYMTFDVAAGASNLVVTTSGGTGNIHLFIKQGANPTASDYDCRSRTSGNDETCTIASPATGTWHVGIKGKVASAGVTMNWSYE